MFSRLRKASELARLAKFAGRQLAFANYVLTRDGRVLPFGMRRTESFWTGATEEVTVLMIEDPAATAAVAQRWLMDKHDNAEFVGIALDTMSTIAGLKQDAVLITARNETNTMRILVFQPYAPATSNAPLRLGAPVIDVAREHASLLDHKDAILANVLKGRDRSPLKAAS